MAREDLEGSPFGRRLQLLVHRLPRLAAAEVDWELERGYHLEVLSDSLFELNLRPRVSFATRADDVGALPIPALSPDARLTRLLVWQKRPLEEAGWSEFATALCSGTGWQAGLILSSSSEHANAVTTYLSRRKLWDEVSCAVLQVFQDSPPSTFFTVEKNLFVLGRVGRRLQRLAVMRRCLPW